MKTNIAVIVSLLVAAAGLAGCTGQFDVQQTEPIRVQLEGEPERVHVEEKDPEPQRIVVENPEMVDSVHVEVKVTRVSAEPVTIVVIIEGEDGERLTEETLVVGDEEESPQAPEEPSPTPDQNETATPDPTPTNETEAPEPPEGEDGQTLIQNIYVDVRGKGNFVVVTQAQQGEADVEVAAYKADGPQEPEEDGPEAAPEDEYGE